MIKGSCVCESIEFEAELMPGVIYNCHCVRCRKSHGAAFATQVFAVKDSLNFLKGKDLLKEYQVGVGIRTFCSVCGSRLMNYADETVDYLSISASVIDTPINSKPVAGECFVSQKLDWVELLDEVPAYEKLPDTLPD